MSGRVAWGEGTMAEIRFLKGVDCMSGRVAWGEGTMAEIRFLKGVDCMSGRVAWDGGTMAEIRLLKGPGKTEGHDRSGPWHSDLVFRNRIRRGDTQTTTWLYD